MFDCNRELSSQDDITVISCMLPCPTTWYLACTLISTWFQWTENEVVFPKPSRLSHIFTSVSFRRLAVLKININRLKNYGKYHIITENYQSMNLNGTLH